MFRDPIVEELREDRAKLFARFGDNLKRYLEFLRAEEERDRDRLVDRSFFQRESTPSPRASEAPESRSRDRIVEEVRETRARLFEACGGDMGRYMEFLEREGKRIREELASTSTSKKDDLTPESDSPVADKVC
jgi:hypothetical protein